MARVYIEGEQLAMEHGSDRVTVPLDRPDTWDVAAKTLVEKAAGFSVSDLMIEAFTLTMTDAASG